MANCNQLGLVCFLYFIEINFVSLITIICFSAPLNDESDCEHMEDETDAHFDSKERSNEVSQSQSNKSNKRKSIKHSNESKKSISNERKDFKFVKCLEQLGGLVLLSKSQLPEIKNKKKKAIEDIINFYIQDGTETFNADQITKKVSNLKQKVKAKADANTTGNNPIDLKPSEKLLWELIAAADNPAITEIKSMFRSITFIYFSFLIFFAFFIQLAGCSVGLGQPVLPTFPKNNEEPTVTESNEEATPIPKSQIPPIFLSAKRKRLNFQQTNSSTSTDSTVHSGLSVRDEVLREQLNLIGQQRKEFEMKAKRDLEEHTACMELIEMQKKLVRQQEDDTKMQFAYFNAKLDDEEYPVDLKEFKLK